MQTRFVEKYPKKSFINININLFKRKRYWSFSVEITIVRFVLIFLKLSIRRSVKQIISDINKLYYQKYDVVTVFETFFRFHLKYDFDFLIVSIENN